MSKNEEVGFASALRAAGNQCRGCGRSGGELTENGCPTCGPDAAGDAVGRFLLEALGDLRIQFWFCPVDGHSGRRGPNGEPILTVEWVGDVAHCTAEGCGRTSATAEGTAGGGQPNASDLGSETQKGNTEWAGTRSRSSSIRSTRASGSGQALRSS